MYDPLQKVLLQKASSVIADKLDKQMLGNGKVVSIEVLRNQQKCQVERRIIYDTIKNSRL